MSLESILQLSERLIKAKSISGSEGEAFAIMETELSSRGFKCKRLGIPNDHRWNLLAAVENPRVLLTTHLDVVPAPEELFQPIRKDGRLWGRGSCDAKGIAAVMVEAATALKNQGRSDIGLLFVVDEETTSSGAKAAAPILKEMQIQYLINGEPTECQLVTGHKGGLTVEIFFKGKPAHSGYPHLGVDANQKLIRSAAAIIGGDFGRSDILGPATVNVGLIEGGVATNVVSPAAKMKCLVRTVTSNAEVYEKIKSLCPEADEVVIRGNAEPIHLHTVPGFQTTAVSYGTDVPYLMPCGAKCLLFGPGTIEVAHTNFESVEFSQLEKAFLGYQQIIAQLD